MPAMGLALKDLPRNDVPVHGEDDADKPSILAAQILNKNIFQAASSQQSPGELSCFASGLGCKQQRAPSFVRVARSQRSVPCGSYSWDCNILFWHNHLETRSNFSRGYFLVDSQSLRECFVFAQVRQFVSTFRSLNIGSVSWYLWYFASLLLRMESSQWQRNRIRRQLRLDALVCNAAVYFPNAHKEGAFFPGLFPGETDDMFRNRERHSTDGFV